MGLIQGIDGGALLAAFRQGKSDRATDDKNKQAKDEAAQWKGLMAQAMGGQPSGGGVTGNYASPSPQTPPVAPGATFDQAFSPQAMTSIQSGPPAAPMAPPPVSRGPDPNVLQKMAFLRPEQTGQVMTVLKTMDEMTIKRTQAKNDALGQAAHFLEAYPEAQRPQMMQIVAQHLAEAGWAPQEIANANLTNDGLKAYQGMAIDYDKIIDNELAERKFQAGDNVAVVPGGNVANIKPNGTAHYVIGGGGQPASAPAVHVKTIEEAQALPPGTHFIDPNGVARTVPGGQTASPSGTFRPVSNGKAVIQELFPNVRVTDNLRPADSALGRANPNSWHVRSGGAVDVAPIPGMTFDQYVSKVKSAGYNIIEAIDEVNHPSAHATGPHWHIVIGQR